MKHVQRFRTLFDGVINLSNTLIRRHILIEKHQRIPKLALMQKQHAQLFEHGRLFDRFPAARNFPFIAVPHIDMQQRKMA